MKAVLVFLAMFPLHILQRELFFLAIFPTIILLKKLLCVVIKTTATKMKRRAQQASVAPEVAKRLDATGDDENPNRPNGSFYCSFESPVILLVGKNSVFLISFKESPKIRGHLGQ